MDAHRFHFHIIDGNGLHLYLKIDASCLTVANRKLYFGLARTHFDSKFEDFRLVETQQIF